VRALVHAEHHAALAFLPEYFKVGAVGTGGDLPLDTPDVIPLPVLPHFLEVQPGAPEDRGVEAAEAGVDKMVLRQAQGSGLMSQFK